METASRRFPSLPWPAGYKPPEAYALQNALTRPAAAAGHVIQLNKTAVVVAKPFRPEAESPLLQRNSFRPDVSKMFRNKTLVILFNCIYTSFRPCPPGPERLPARACPCLQGFLLSVFHVFKIIPYPLQIHKLQQSCYQPMKPPVCLRDLLYLILQLSQLLPLVLNLRAQTLPIQYQLFPAFLRVQDIVLQLLRKILATVILYVFRYPVREPHTFLVCFCHNIN